MCSSACVTAAYVRCTKAIVLSCFWFEEVLLKWVIVASKLHYLLCKFAFISQNVSCSFTMALSQIAATLSAVMHTNDSCHARISPFSYAEFFWAMPGLCIWLCHNLAHFHTSLSSLCFTIFNKTPLLTALHPHLFRRGKIYRRGGQGEAWEKKRYIRGVESISGTYEGKTTWWKDAHKNTVMEENEWRFFWDLMRKKIKMMHVDG